jgi:hypothetical protein
MNNKIQKQIKMLQKPPKTIRKMDNTECRSVSKVAVKFSIGERLRRIAGYILQREEWYDSADSKIILRLPNKITEDLSVNDYRYNFLSAVHIHISLKNSTMDAANNNSLSLWRYKKYMYEWMLCKQLERFLQSFQKKPQDIRCNILPHLERLIKKLQVLITICTVYICIKQGEDNVNVDNFQFFNMTNPEIDHPIYVALHDSDLVAALAAFDDKSLATEETAYTIPDHVRLVSTGLADFIQSLSQAKTCSN